MIDVTVTTQEVDRMLNTLQSETDEILNEGLKAASEVYLKSVIQSLRREMGSAADTTGIKTGYSTYNYPLSSGIAIYENPNQVIYGVNALKDFRLRFFEGGTKQRKTKGRKITGKNGRRLTRTGKGGNRGSITANHFFTKGINSAEDNALKLLEQTIIQALKNRGIE